MDEPLSNLDAKLRVQMRAEIASLQSRLGVTTVYVTHDQSEAMTLGDRVAVLGDGRLQQCDTPRVLYERPANTFVAGFIGSPAMNLCRCRGLGERVGLARRRRRRAPERGARRGAERGRRRPAARGARARRRRDRRRRRRRRGDRRRRLRLRLGGRRRRADEARRPRRGKGCARARLARHASPARRRSAPVRPGDRDSALARRAEVRSWGGAPRFPARRRPACRRRGDVRAARPRVERVAAARRADLRPVARDRRGGRAGDLAARARRARPVRGPLVAEDLGLPHPRQHREDAGAARRACAAVLVAAAIRAACPEAAVDPDRFRPEDDERYPGHWSSPPRELPEERLLAAETRAQIAAAIEALPANQAP